MQSINALQLPQPSSMISQDETSTQYKDPLRPNDEAFKVAYELGFETWHQLYKAALEDRLLPHKHLCFESLVAHHPRVPAGIRVDDTGFLTARSLWSPGGSCGLPSFEQDFWMNTVINEATTVSLVRNSSSWLKECFGPHLAVLVPAWAYVFSARWANLIPRMTQPAYTDIQAVWIPPHDLPEAEREERSIVQFGQITTSAARWWSAVLAPGIGWRVIRTHKKHQLLSPWCVKLDSDDPLYLTRYTGTKDDAKNSPPSFEVATTYIQDYCYYHDITHVNQAAFAAALLLPLANLEKRSITLPSPHFYQPLPQRPLELSGAVWNNENHHLDRLLTLSCNTVGMKATLGSIFYQPGLESNLCGAWIQGTFSLLHSINTHNLGTLAGMFSHRCPQLTGLWLGGIITGAQNNFLRSTRELLGFNRIELHAAAWTGTVQSFVQDPVSKSFHDPGVISRADECRLLYLSRVRFKEHPPAYPFPPPGEILLEDTDLDVRLHTHCAEQHQLRFLNIRWKLEDGNEEVQELTRTMSMNLSSGTRPVYHDNPVHVETAKFTLNYAYLDRENDFSEIVTRNLFTWMRDPDGYPASEKSIYRHPWIDTGESSDEEEPSNVQNYISEETISSVKIPVQAWILNVKTAARSNSM